MNKILSKLTNTKTVLGITGYVITILITLGLRVDSVAVTAVVTAACGILVLLGIINDEGMETTTWNDTKKEEDTEK